MSKDATLLGRQIFKPEIQKSLSDKKCRGIKILTVKSSASKTYFVEIKNKCRIRALSICC